MNLNLVWMLFLSITLSGCVSKLASIKNDLVQDLQNDVGYLFITIDTNISFSQFSIEGAQNVRLTNPDFHNGKNYYLVAVSAGQYKVKQFSVFFGGRYKFDQDEDEELWSFSVVPGKISYVGDLRVRATGFAHSSFELINNSSFALEYLENKYPKILSNRVLEYHGPGQDSFFSLVFNNYKNKDEH